MTGRRRTKKGSGEGGIKPTLHAHGPPGETVQTYRMRDDLYPGAEPWAEFELFANLEEAGDTRHWLDRRLIDIKAALADAYTRAKNPGRPPVADWRAPEALLDDINRYDQRAGERMEDAESAVRALAALSSKPPEDVERIVEMEAIRVRNIASDILHCGLMLGALAAHYHVTKNFRGFAETGAKQTQRARAHGRLKSEKSADIHNRLAQYILEREKADGASGRSRPKPKTEYFKVAAKRFGLSPSRVRDIWYEWVRSRKTGSAEDTRAP